MENLRQATGDLESMAASLQTNVETLTTRADDTLVAFESMASSIDREITVTSKDARELIDSLQQTADRKSVVSGNRVSVRVDIGGRRIIKKKKTKEAS